jgi:hypothetical protein
VIRGSLALGGIAAIGWGAWLLRDDGLERWRSQATWLLGGVIVHDGLLAPLVVLVGVVASRMLRPGLRRIVAAGFIVWATVTVSAANVLLPVGGRPDNQSLMNRPYVLAWLAFTGCVLVLAAVATVRSRATGADQVITN